MNLDQNDINHSTVADVDLSNNKIIIKKDGIYRISMMVTYNASANWSSGDEMQTRIKIGSSVNTQHTEPHEGVNLAYACYHEFVADVTANKDVIGEVFHDTGSDESIGGSATRNYLLVQRIG